MSRFVSAGTDENPVTRDEAWLKAQQEIDTRRKPRHDDGKQDGGKSLYEVLQANKAAKQDAFEESIRLKNQFRTLDDDEVEFLDSVLESTRAKEAAVKQETAEQLENFRKQREAAEQAALDAAPGDGAKDTTLTAFESWKTKKRRRKEKEGTTSKLRKLSSSEGKQPDHRPPSTHRSDPASSSSTPQPSVAIYPVRDFVPESKEDAVSEAQTQSKTVSTGLGLGAYSSDED